MKRRGRRTAGPPYGSNPITPTLDIIIIVIIIIINIIIIITIIIIIIIIITHIMSSWY